MKTILSRLVISCLVGILGWTTVQAQQWPTFRHDHARSGLVQSKIEASRLELTWSWKSLVPPDPAWDGPARWDAYAGIRELPAMRQYDACFHPVSDGKRLYFGSSSQDTLTCLSLSDGKKLWSYVAGGPIRLAPTLYDSLVLFGCDDGNAYCLDSTSGKLVWKFNPSAERGAEQRSLINNDRLISFFPIRTGVTVRDGIAYFGASFLPWRESYICAVDAKSGKLEPSKNTFVVRHEKATLEGSLLVAENRLIVPQGRVAPLLFDRSNGKSLGSLPGGGGVTIVLTESGEVVRAEGGRDARAGHVGVFKGKERVASFPRGRAIVINGDFFYVIDGQKLFAAERATNELKWTREVDEPLELVMTDKTIFVGGRNHVTAVNADNGNVLWSSETEGRVFGLAIAGDRLIASTDVGAIHVFSATAEKGWASKENAATETWKSPSVPRVRDRNLLHRWVFHRSAMKQTGRREVDSTKLLSVIVKDQAGRLPLQLNGQAQSVLLPGEQPVEAIELAEGNFPLDAVEARKLPDQSLTVESWVRVDETQNWGGIVGFIQDDGAVEHGWLLGYRDNKFCFALAGGGNGMTYMNANDDFELGSWNHVVGTYNGREMRLYVNGSLAASSTEESGPISQSEDQYFTVGAYRDANESYPLVGALNEVRIYSQTLDATTVSKLYQSRASKFPTNQSEAQPNSAPSSFLRWGPYVRFLRPGEIEITYGTDDKCESVIDLIGDEVNRFLDSKKTKEHRLVLKALPHRRELQFQIRRNRSESADATESFALDTHFDWTSMEVVADGSAKDEWVQRVVDESPNPRGIVLVIGESFAEQARRLAKTSQYRVLLVVDDEKVAKRIRDEWSASRIYGRKLAVLVKPVRELPAAFASVVLSDDKSDLVRRLVRPQGGILHNGDEVTWKRGKVAGSGVWSHMYGQADNSAFGGEELSDASVRSDLLTQWIGRPGPRYQTDRQNRKPSPLAAGGRLFLQGQQRMISLDSYSGSVLWSVESPTVMRWNVPHDCSNWCADENGVYVAAQSQAWFLDGRTGEIKKRFELPVSESEAVGMNWGYISRYQDQLLGSVVRADAIYTKWWGKSQWFDSTGGDDTHVVAGDWLFSLDSESGKLQWKYKGLVLHPTITVMDGCVFFVEDKTVDHQTNPNRRISLDANQKHELVCLDVTDGKVRWRRPLDSFQGHLASLYLAGGGAKEKRRLVLVGSESTKKEFFISTLDPINGTPVWDRTVAWESTHHGKHISRPAIQAELLYLRPEVIDLDTGKTLKRGFPGGHGCSSYTLSTGGVFTRLGETTWWNPRSDKVNRFSRIRTDCWISVVPAQGMLLSAEGGGGCSCGTWLETSLGFLPRSVDEDLPEK